MDLEETFRNNQERKKLNSAGKERERKVKEKLRDEGSRPNTPKTGEVPVGRGRGGAQRYSRQSQVQRGRERTREYPARIADCSKSDSKEGGECH